MRDISLFLFPYVKRKFKLFLPMVLLITIGAIAQTYIPLQVRDIIDNVLNNLEVSSPSRLIFNSFLIIVGLSAVDWLTEISARFLNNRFNQGIQFEIRQDIYKVLQSQELEFYSMESIGQIMARTFEEVASLRELLGWGLRILLLIIILYFSAAIVMLQTSVVLGLVYLLLAPIVLATLSKISRNNAQIFYNTRFKFGEVNEVMAESYSGIKTVKSFGRELDQIENFNNINNEFFHTAMKEINVRSTLQPMMILFINIGVVVVLFIAGLALNFTFITSGDFIAFMLLTINLVNRGRFLGDLSISVEMGNAAAKRLNEVLKSKTYLVEREEPIPIPDDGLDIDFENVTFRYPEAHVNSLENVSFTIPAGEKVALLGTTGCGKTTLVNLIPRFFDPGEGEIYLSGHNIKDYSLTELRRKVGIVHQDNFLYTMTIKENIAFGNPNATDEEVISAAKIAQIHNFISNLPDGYNTIVGERGVTLSGGQRQRVAIARAVLPNPKVLVFDDSVSAVDPETEAKLQDTIGGAATNRTIIVISQRPSSLRYVDRILVLDEGRIAQDGTHEELKSCDGIYKRFTKAVESQIKFIAWDKEGLA